MSGDYDEPHFSPSVMYDLIVTKQNDSDKSIDRHSQDNDDIDFAMVTSDVESRISEPSFTDLINQYLNTDDSEEE